MTRYSGAPGPDQGTVFWPIAALVLLVGAVAAVAVWLAVGLIFAAGAAGIVAAVNRRR